MAKFTSPEYDRRTGGRRADDHRPQTVANSGPTVDYDGRMRTMTMRGWRRRHSAPQGEPAPSTAAQEVGDPVSLSKETGYRDPDTVGVSMKELFEYIEKKNEGLDREADALAEDRPTIVTPAGQTLEHVADVARLAGRREMLREIGQILVEGNDPSGNIDAHDNPTHNHSLEGPPRSDALTELQ